MHLPGFARLAGVDVIAIADSGSGRAREIAAKASIPRAYSDWRQIVEAPDIDAVSVVVPPRLHLEIVAAALAAGKHVLCEKPFGKTLQDAKSMTRLWSESNQVGAIDFLFRMEPGIAALKRHVRAGLIGKLKRIDVAWLTGGQAESNRPFGWQHDAAAGGGVLGAMASHVFDYVEWISDSMLNNVYARGQILVPSRPNECAGHENVTAEDCIDLVCELQNGAVLSGRISNCYRYGHGHRIEIDGDEGRLVFHHHPPFKSSDLHLRFRGRSGEQMISDDATADDDGADTRIGSFRRLARQFVDQIQGKYTADLPDFNYGLRVRHVLDAAERSLQEGRPVSCPC